MNYWVVGAMWGGKVENDVLDEFLEQGYWYCWDQKATPPDEETAGGGNSVAAQRERFKKILPEDRIAVKKNVSVKEQKIEIRAIGIVKEVDLDAWRVYVNWIPIAPQGTHLSRIVDMHGNSASVHGPFEATDPWVREIFCI